MFIRNSNRLERLHTVLTEIFEKSSLTPKELMHDIETLSNHYTSKPGHIKFKNPALPYALYFMPEHLPKILFILTELRERFLDIKSKTQVIYDLGSGTGTGTIAYKILFGDDIPSILTDTNSEMLNLATEILSKMSFKNFKSVTKDYLQEFELPDIPSMFILMNTLSENIKNLKRINELIQKILSNTSRATIIIIEPVTEKGTEIVSNLRNVYGSFTIMPCPSSGICPLAKEKRRICRFNISNKISVSLQPIITARHSIAKFCYLVLCNIELPQEKNLFRVIDDPVKRNFGFEINVCNQKLLYYLKVRAKESLSRKRIGSLSSNDLIRIKEPDLSLSSPIKSEQVEIVFSKKLT